MTEKIQIVVIDDHPLFREGVVSTLRAEPDFEIVAEGTSAQQAIGLAGEHLPDLLLLDINIPGGGLTAVPQIAASSPVTKIIMLTASEAEDDVVTALKAGARAYIVKGVAARELKNILRSVQNGEAYVTPTLAASLLSDFQAEANKKTKNSPLQDLTEREREISRICCQRQEQQRNRRAIFLSGENHQAPHDQHPPKTPRPQPRRSRPPRPESVSHRQSLNACCLGYFPEVCKRAARLSLSLSTSKITLPVYAL